MKTRFLVSTVSALSMLGGAAFANDTATDDLDLEGTQANVCVLTAPADTDVALGTLGGDDAVLASGDIDAEVSFGDSYCNFAHTLTLSSENGALVNDDADGLAAPGTSDDIASSIDYIAAIADGEWGAALTLNTSTNTATGAAEDNDVDIDTAFRNDAAATGGNDDADGLTITIDDLGSDVDGTPLLTGTYADTLTVTLGPQA